VVFALRVLPGGARPEAVITGAPSIIPKLTHGGPAVMIVEPSGDRIEGQVMTSVADGKRTLSLAGLALDAATRIAGASALRIEGGAQRLSIPVARPVRALAALQECIDSRMREWGIDPVAFAAMREAPEGALWLEADDYPEEALRTAAQGTVTALLTTDVSGKVTDCAVIISSRSKVLDAATCRAALKRGRYTPAIGADNNPIAAKFITRTTWRMH
jgi:TonB family protein